MFKYLAIFSVIFSMPINSAKAEVEKYVAFNLASYHVNAKAEYNERNPGVAFGFSNNIGSSERLRYGGEVGFYLNSFSELSRYGLVNADYEIASIGENTRLRLGAFIGLFEYPSVIEFAQKNGFPTMGNYIVVPGLMGTIQFNSRYDIRIRVAPAAKHADLIVGLQIAVRF